jgi:hypothetical protein
MSNLLNFILTADIKKLEHYNNQINNENLRNHCMARGLDNLFFKIICQRYKRCFRDITFKASTD